MLSNYCKEIADKNGLKLAGVKKFVPNLGNKTNNVVHYRNLQLYLLLGIKSSKIHKVLKFNWLDWKSDWMKNISILTLKKENMLLTVLKKIF